MEEIRIIIDRYNDQVNNEFTKNRLAVHREGCLLLHILLTMAVLWCTTTSYNTSQIYYVVRLIFGVIIINAVALLFWVISYYNVKRTYYRVRSISEIIISNNQMVISENFGNMTKREKVSADGQIRYRVKKYCLEMIISPYQIIAIPHSCITDEQFNKIVEWFPKYKAGKKRLNKK